jgi:hypothetical protein
MNGVLNGVNRDQLMGRHKANHIQVAYASDSEKADNALAAKAAMLDEIGIQINICGSVSFGN